MIRRGWIAVVALASGVAALGFGTSAVIASQAGAVASRTPSMCGTKAAPPRYKHVIVILFENHAFGTIYKSSSAPYINKVMAACGVATNYHNLTHSSLPNYLGITYGGTLHQLAPYVNDCDPSSCSQPVSANNLFNQVASRGWIDAAESMPRNCDRSATGNYAPKHNPAVYFSDLSASCGTHDVALGSPSDSMLLGALSKESTAPAFTFMSPNLCDDMHDCSIATGDNWLKTWLPLITGSTVYKDKDTAVFITWDEGEPDRVGENCAANPSDQSCHVPAIVVAPSVKPGTKVGTLLSHYSVLRTSEFLLGVPYLGGAQSATGMAKAFNL